MVQPAVDTYQFHLGRSSYKRSTMIGWLMLAGQLLIAVVAVIGSSFLWTSYTHDFTPYLKWQDALLWSLWFISYVCLLGSGLVVRFLHALRQGYRKGMLTLISNRSIAVRDLSPQNYVSILWVMQCACVCFLVVLAGLVPLVSIGWTLHFPHPALIVIGTTLAVLLSAGGIVLSVVFIIFIIVGSICMVPFGRKLGAQQHYTLSGLTVLRIDDHVLTIINPAVPESMLDLRLLAEEDWRQLLLLVKENWVKAEKVWNPDLGEEIEEALEVAPARKVPVLV